MHPWGLSGPEFLWLYLGGLVVGLAVAIGWRMAVRRPRLAEPPGRLTPEELGFLAGGPLQAVQVAVARLVDAGVVRVNRSGNLSSLAAGQLTGHPLDDAVLGKLTRTRKVAAVAESLAGIPVVTGIGESLVSRGLLVRPALAIRTRRLAPVLLYVLFVIGVVRWLNGIMNDLPTGFLTVLLAATFVSTMCLSTRTIAAPTARTVHGDRVLAEVKARGKEADPLERVAATGLMHYPDKELAEALSVGAAMMLAGSAWSYASVGSFDAFVHGSSGSGTASYDYTSSSGSSSSDGGGGGCGGGNP